MDTAKLTVRLPKSTIHPEVEKISGLIPEDVDARAEYRAHILEKYRCAALRSTITTEEFLLAASQG